MRKVSLSEMKRNPEKLAWRIGVTGFTNKGNPVYYLLTKKEALESNPTKEYAYMGEIRHGV
jgi:hypothetical protein